MQPLDVGIFKPLRRAYEIESDKYTSRHGIDSIKLSSFAEVLLPAYKSAVNAQICAKAFRKCGLLPFNIDKIDFSKIKANHKRKENPDTSIGVPKGSKLDIHIL